jgi:hypothetical protein
MTPDSNKPVEMLAVTQEAREAAAEYSQRPGSGHYKRIIAGEMDHLDLVQAFARFEHRLSSTPAAADDPDEAYEIGKRDGYGEALQAVDQATGGDGEYRYCLGNESDDRHRPDEPTMLRKIVARLSSTPTADRVGVDLATLDKQVEHWIEDIAPACVDCGPKVREARTGAMQRLYKRIRSSLTTQDPSQ